MISLTHLIGFKQGKKDNRRLTHHNTYHLSKFFGLFGAGLLTVALMVLMLFMKDETMFFITLSLCVLGVFIFAVGAVFFFLSIYRTLVEQNRDVQVTTEAVGGSVTTMSEQATNVPDRVPNSPIVFTISSPSM